MITAMMVRKVRTPEEIEAAMSRGIWPHAGFGGVAESVSASSNLAGAPFR